MVVENFPSSNIVASGDYIYYSRYVDDPPKLGYDLNHNEDKFNLSGGILFRTNIYTGEESIAFEMPDYVLNGVEIDRFEKMYRILIEDTKKALPNVKMILCEPFVLKGAATAERFDRFKEVYKYAEVVKRLANEYGLYFLPLQEGLSAVSAGREEEYLRDGVHPAQAGAKWIAEEWLKAFDALK